MVLVSFVCHQYPNTNPWAQTNTQGIFCTLKFEMVFFCALKFGLVFCLYPEICGGIFWCCQIFVGFLGLIEGLEVSPHHYYYK
jgi:hypothetical protein